MPGPPSPAEIEAAMKAVAEDGGSPGARSTLESLLRDAEFVVATPAAPDEPERREIPAGESLQFVTIEHEGEIVLPVFTSTDRLAEWITEDAGYALLPAAVLFELTRATGIEHVAINPGAEITGTLEAGELEALAGPDADQGISGEVEVRIGPPAEPLPEEVLGAVRTAIACEPQASGGWVFLMAQEGETPGPVIAIELPESLDADGLEQAMRTVLGGLSGEHPDLADLRFMPAEPGLLQTLREGAGIEIFRR